MQGRYVHKNCIYFFSSPGPKVHYYHHLAYVGCQLFTFQASFPKPLGQLEPNLPVMFLGWSSTKFLFFFPVGYSTWLPGPIIYSDWLRFQRSETTWIIETKLARNDHWKVLYKVFVFYADGKSKMATTAGHMLTLYPMVKCWNAFFFRNYKYE